MKLPPWHLALIDQQSAALDHHLDEMVTTTRELDADDGGIPALAQLTTILMYGCAHDKMAMLCAAAILRLARADPPGGTDGG
jgi:hypothetical protein